MLFGMLPVKLRHPAMLFDGLHWWQIKIPQVAKFSTVRWNGKFEQQISSIEAHLFDRRMTLLHHALMIRQPSVSELAGSQPGSPGSLTAIEVKDVLIAAITEGVRDGYIDGIPISGINEDLPLSGVFFDSLSLNGLLGFLDEAEKRKTGKGIAEANLERVGELVSAASSARCGRTIEELAQEVSRVIKREFA